MVLAYVFARRDFKSAETRPGIALAARNKKERRKENGDYQNEQDFDCRKVKFKVKHLIHPSLVRAVACKYIILYAHKFVNQS